jgi:hypothetical protein
MVPRLGMLLYNRSKARRWFSFRVDKCLAYDEVARFSPGLNSAVDEALLVPCLIARRLVRPTTSLRGWQKAMRRKDETQGSKFFGSS